MRVVTNLDFGIASDYFICKVISSPTEKKQ